MQYIQDFKLLAELYDNNEQELNNMFKIELGELTHDDINLLPDFTRNNFKNIITICEKF